MPTNHVHRLQVAYSDTDAQGHVAFANYLTYFDAALGGYFKSLGFPWLRLMELGVDLVHADAHVSYHGRASHEDVLEIEVSIEKMGSSSFTSCCTAKKEDGSVVATGELVSMCVDRNTLKSTQLPSLIREAVRRA
jgi:acyl-CoA thioester hydrolase